MCLLFFSLQFFQIEDRNPTSPLHLETFLYFAHSGLSPSGYNFPVLVSSHRPVAMSTRLSLTVPSRASGSSSAAWPSRTIPMSTTTRFVAPMTRPTTVAATDDDATSTSTST